MLGLMRKHKKKLFFTLYLVIFAFALLYTDISRRERAATQAEELAISIGKEKIYKQEIMSAYLRMKKSFNLPETDTNLNSLILQQAVESVISDHIQKIIATEMGFKVSEKELADRIALLFSNPFFYDKNGNLNIRLINQVINRQMNMSLEEYQNAISQDILISKLRDFLTGWIDVKDEEVKDAYIKKFVKAKVELVKIETKDLLKDITLTDKDVKNFYEEHKQDFKTPEKRKFKYLLLKVDDFIKEVNIPQEEIQRYYNQNQESFKEEEQVRARHILLRIGNKNEEDVKKQIQALLNRAKAGEDFAQLAKQYSEDLASASNGGDLGYFQRGRMVKEFEDLAFSLKIGDIGGPVKTNFGYHIIKIEDHKPKRIKTLFEVQDEIRKLLASPQAEVLLKNKINEIKTWIKQQNINDLSDLSKKFNYQIKTSDYLSNQDSNQDLSNFFIEKGFTLNMKEISEPINFLDSFVIMQCVEIKSPEIKPFDEVKKEAEEKAKQDKAKALALNKLKELKKVLETESDFKKAAESLSLKVEETDKFSQSEPVPNIGENEKISSLIFSMKVGDISEPLEYENGYVVVKLSDKHDFDEKELEKERSNLKKELLSAKKQQFFNEFIKKAKEKYQIKIIRNEKVIQSIIS